MVNLNLHSSSYHPVLLPIPSRFSDRSIKVESAFRVILSLQLPQLLHPPGLVAIHLRQGLVTKRIVDIGTKLL